MRSFSFRRSQGMSVVEIVVAAAVIAAVVGAAAGAWAVYLRLANTAAQKDQVALMTEEGSEILRFLRDTGWATNIATLTAGTTYYLHWSGSAYSLTTTPESQNSLTRTVIFSAVSRDGSYNITTNGGSNDPSTRKVDIAIYASTTPLLSSEMLLHNMFNN